MRLFFSSLVCCLFLVVMGHMGAFASSEAVTIDPDSQYQYAQYLYSQGQYASAAAEYQRFAYFFPEDPRQRQSLLGAGTSLLQAGSKPSAIALLHSLTEIHTLDEPAIEAYFMLAEAYLQANQPGQAVMALYNLISLTTDEVIADRAYYRLGWIRIDQLDWQAAQQTFDHLSDSGRTRYRAEELDRALAGKDELPTKSPVLAGFLSIIPGAGQLYNERYEDALTAFVVDVGLLWGAYEAYNEGLNVLGTLLAIVGTGFYTSNIYSAVSSAHKYNRDSQIGYAGQLKNRLRVGIGPSSGITGHPVLTLQLKF